VQLPVTGLVGLSYKYSFQTTREFEVTEELEISELRILVRDNQRLEFGILTASSTKHSGANFPKTQTKA
jgi:hypothetical protein